MRIFRPPVGLPLHDSDSLRITQSFSHRRNIRGAIIQSLNVYFIALNLL